MIAIQELPYRILFSSDAPYGNPLVARTIVEQAQYMGNRRHVVGYKYRCFDIRI